MNPTPLQHVRISKAASILGVSIKTLRRWEEAGIIHATRNSQNQRVYSITEIKSISRRRYQPLPQPPTVTTKKTVFLPISEAATQLGVSIKTIRRWDEAGKIKSHRNHRNQRVFSLESILQAKQAQTSITLPTSQMTKINPTKNILPSPISKIKAYPLPPMQIISIILATTAILVSFQSSPPSTTLDSNQNINNYPTSTLNASENLGSTTLLPSQETNYSQLEYLQTNNILEEVSLTNAPIYQDLEITSPLTTTDLLRIISQPSTSSNNQLKLSTQEYQPSHLYDSESFTVHSLNTQYIKVIPLPPNTINPSLEAVTNTPAGETINPIILYNPDSHEYVLIQLLDQVGTWHITWNDNTNQYSDSDSFQVIDY